MKLYFRINFKRKDWKDKSNNSLREKLGNNKKYLTRNLGKFGKCSWTSTISSKPTSWTSKRPSKGLWRKDENKSNRGRQWWKLEFTSPLQLPFTKSSSMHANLQVCLPRSWRLCYQMMITIPGTVCTQYLWKQLHSTQCIKKFLLIWWLFLRRFNSFSPTNGFF